MSNQSSPASWLLLLSSCCPFLAGNLLRVSILFAEPVESVVQSRPLLCQTDYRWVKMGKEQETEAVPFKEG